MKLRIKGNTLRVRLSDRELSQLVNSGVVADMTQFPEGAVLRTELVTLLEAPAISVTYRQDLIRISLPERSAQEWIESAIEELKAVVSVDGGTLHVSLEKDLDRAE
jgi:hypothetical protein